MKPLNKILLVNGIIMLVYALLSLLMAQGEGHYTGMGFMIFMMMAVGIHVGVMLLIGLYHFFRKNSEMGKYFLLGTLLVGVVGFSACFGGGSLLSSSASSNYTPREAVGQIITPMGEILFRFHNETPAHKSSFMNLANSAYWDTLTFNRVIPDFVAQGGCPDTPEGFSDSPYLLEPEFADNLRHIYGAVGAGRDDNPEKLSAGCQFYIVQNKEGIPRLDGNYTVFGQVFKGMDVVDAIVNVERDSLDTPLEPVTLEVNIIWMKASEITLQE